MVSAEHACYFQNVIRWLPANINTKGLTDIYNHHLSTQPRQGSSPAAVFKGREEKSGQSNICFPSAVQEWCAFQLTLLEKKFLFFCLMNVVYPGIFGQLSVRAVRWWESIILCLIWMAAGTAPALTARDSSQIFSARKVWSLLEHSSIPKFGPLFSWTAFKLHKGLFPSWLMVIHIHQTCSTRQPLGEKWPRHTLLLMSC